MGCAFTACERQMHSERVETFFQRARALFVGVALISRLSCSCWTVENCRNMLRLLASELLVDAVLVSGAETTLSRRSDVSIDDDDLRGLCPLLYLPTTRFTFFKTQQTRFNVFF